MKRGEASTRPKKRRQKPSTKPSKTSKQVETAAKLKAEKPKAAKRRAKKKAKAQKPGETKVAKPEKEVEEKARIDAPTVVGIKQLLKLREEVRKSRPRFLRQESWRYIRVGDAWRRPKGIDSKMRRAKKGWPGLVDIGFRGPAKARGLHPSGFRDVLVNTVSDLERLNPETDAVRLASGLGAKKRRDILDRADELGLKVLNPRGIRVIRSRE